MCSLCKILLFTISVIFCMQGAQIVAAPLRDIVAA
jgi:ACR3 family arsenite efflux pump ArsB